MLEVVVGSFIMLILLVPGLQGLTAAYNSYLEVQHELQLIAYNKLIVAYYNELLHSETELIDSTSASNLASNYSVVLTDSDISEFTYTNTYIGNPKNAATYGSAYYVNPPVTDILSSPQLYLVSFSTSVTGFSTPVLQTTMITAAYYDAQ